MDGFGSGNLQKKQKNKPINLKKKDESMNIPQKKSVLFSEKG